MKVFNQLSSLGRTLMENLTNSSNLPLKRKGAGYSLQMAGFFNDRYNISLSEAEEAAEEAVISSLLAGLESYAIEKTFCKWNQAPYQREVTCFFMSSHMETSSFKEQVFIIYTGFFCSK